MSAVCFGFIFNTPAHNPCVEFLTHTWSADQLWFPLFFVLNPIGHFNWSLARTDTEINCVDRVAHWDGGSKCVLPKCWRSLSQLPALPLFLPWKTHSPPISTNHEPQSPKSDKRKHICRGHPTSARYSVSICIYLHPCPRAIVCVAGTWRDLFICLCEWPVCGRLCLDLAVWAAATIKLKKNLYMHMSLIKGQGGWGGDRQEQIRWNNSKTNLWICEILLYCSNQETRRKFNST